MYCADLFQSQSELERHKNSVHLGPFSWSCGALDDEIYNLIYPSFTFSIFDTCGYCGAKFPNHPSPDWEARRAHINDVHKFDECNNCKKFRRVDHFRQHLKHSHAGIIGEWMKKLEKAGMRDKPAPVPQGKNGQHSRKASPANASVGASNMGPVKVEEDTKCLFCGENNLHVEGSRRRHLERHMEEVAFAIVSKPYEEWDFYSESSSEHSSDVEAENIFSSQDYRSRPLMPTSWRLGKRTK